MQRSIEVWHAMVGVLATASLSLPTKRWCASIATLKTICIIGFQIIPSKISYLG